MATYVKKNNDFEQIAPAESSKEQFRYNYLPRNAQRFLREAFASYSADLFLGFGVLCRKTIAVAAAESAADAAPGFEKLFEDATELGQIERPTQNKLREVLFGTAPEPDIDADQAAVLIEIVKDMFEQRYVRTAQLRRAIKMRRFFAHQALAPERFDAGEPVLERLRDN